MNRPLLLSLVTLAALAVPQAAEAQGTTRAPDSDQTVAVTKGARLTISNFAGEVALRTWEKDSLRVAARHTSRVKVDVLTTPTLVTVRSGGHGVGSVDYEITAPTWMPVKVDGTYNFVSIEGVQSEVSATTIRGDIEVKGGTGFITAKSIEGIVTVDGAKGRINASSVNEAVKISGSSGDIVVETTNGDISLSNVDARSVDIGTINGDVTFEGRLSGRYRVATHNGDIVLTIPANTNATFSVRTYNGDLTTNLPLQGAKPADVSRGRRVTFTLGSGDAEVELESFGGEIRIQRK